ncbi:unnamed protein product [Sphagnum tenellum]
MSGCRIFHPYASLTSGSMSYPAGFISIDCGSNSTYTDSNSITWVPDTGYIFTGRNFNPMQLPGLPPSSLLSLRYFPEDRTKHCYNLPANRSQTYMVRVTFVYFDFLGTGASPPTFNLEIQAQLPGTVSFTSSIVSYFESYFVTTSDSIFVCLARINSTSGTTPTSTMTGGIPFITSLELRALDTASMYSAIVKQGLSMYNIWRRNVGATSDQEIRYPDDIYDRQWFSSRQESNAISTAISTTQPINVSSSSNKVPAKVMQTAETYARGQTLTLNMTHVGLESSNRDYYLAFYFAEIDPQAVNQSRIFDLYVNEQLEFANISVLQLSGGLMYSTLEIIVTNVTLNNTAKLVQLIPHADSALGPILNAYELFDWTSMSSLTFPSDAFAIESFKETLNLTSWTGDPCVYTSYNWITCSDNTKFPRIATVKLSDYNLTGDIPEVLNNLTMLTTLRLQNNQISGPIPAWLGSLNSLQELDLSNNNLSGSIPLTLLEKGVAFQASGNPYLNCVGSMENCLQSPTSSPTSLPASSRNNVHGKNNLPVIIGAIMGGLLVVISIALVLLYLACYSRKVFSQGKLETATIATPSREGLLRHRELKYHGGPQVVREYSLEEVTAMTNNFEKLLGKGGFGLVHYGRQPNGLEVAVKRLSSTSHQGAVEFCNEVDLLSTVHHKNLVSLIGYCQQDKERILIYEYMPNGTLRESLYGTERALENPLNWKTRLNIALNAAQGLEYLHKSCKHPIIHRDVKSSNILLSTDMVAKVADFGLSKITMEEGVSHISTLVKGTAGYLDPEYYAKQQLTDKSDVFSFGVVLLELICGRQPIDTSFRHENQWNIGVWVRPFLQSGILQPVVDQALGNNYNVESMWKVAETAMRSIEPYSANRPTMTEVVCDIREAIEMDNGQLYDASSNTSNSYSQQPIATMLRTNHHSTYPSKCV